MRFKLFNFLLTTILALILPGCGRNDLTLAGKLLESGDYLGAKEYYATWVKKHPFDPSGHYGLGMSYCAEAIFKTELGFSQPDDWYKPLYHVSRALTLGNTSDTRYTLAILNYNLGSSYRKAGNTSAAISRLEQAILYDSTILKAVNLLGALYHETGDLQNAHRCYTSATLLEPYYALPYFNLGALAWANDDLLSAQHYFEKASSLEPSNTHFKQWKIKAEEKLQKMTSSANQ